MVRTFVVVPALALSLALLASGCTEKLQSFDKVYDPCMPLVLVPTGPMTEDERASVDDAIEMWRAVADVGLTTEETPGARLLAVEMIDTEIYMGAFDDESGVIRLARRVDLRRPRAVVLSHELGHAFNLFHVKPKERASVMHQGNWEIAPTAGDADALEQKWGPCVAW